MGLDDGSVLVAQNDNSQVVRIDPTGRQTVVHRDTNTGGAVAMNKKGQLFVAERGLHAAVLQLAPERKPLADRFRGEPLDCVSRRGISDLTADAKGGVYFTMGDLYYANPRGEISRYGDKLRTNGIILSADERTLYVTSGGNLMAFDVQPDGSLTRQRVFAKLQGSFGDGGAIDSEGRIYTTGGPGIDVIAADGTHLGVITAPRRLVSIAFGGPDKKRLYAVASILPPEGGYKAQLMWIPMLATGYKGRAK
jgi:sugar lactone lactonase YvrE